MLLQRDVGEGGISFSGAPFCASCNHLFAATNATLGLSVPRSFMNSVRARSSFSFFEELSSVDLCPIEDSLVPDWLEEDFDKEGKLLSQVPMLLASSSFFGDDFFCCSSLETGSLDTFRCCGGQRCIWWMQFFISMFFHWRGANLWIRIHVFCTSSYACGGTCTGCLLSSHWLRWYHGR